MTTQGPIDSARQDINAAIGLLNLIGADVLEASIPAESADRIEKNLTALRGRLADAVNALNRIGESNRDAD
ncbi:MAG: hypothetical protein OXG72_00110 [Acidobacteria bacterium]|nr:hypothetical protein [Acidobacteriota bacterium]